MAARRRKSRKAGAARRPTGAVRRPARRRKATRPRRAKPAPKPKRRKAATPRPKAKPRATAAAKPRATAAAKPRATAAAKPRATAAAKPRAAAAPRAGGAPPRLVSGAPVEVGVVLHFYPRAAAAVVALSRPIHRGDTIHVRGQTTDFVQPVRELALEGAPVSEGAPPQQIGVRFEQRARAGDRVFRVSW